MTNHAQSLETGITAIDLEHKRLVGLANLIINSDKKQRERMHTDNFIAMLLSAVKQHIGHEEELMIRIGYRKADDHITAHSVLLDDLLKSFNGYLGGTNTADDVLNNFCFVMFLHWRTHDDELGRHIVTIREKRRKSPGLVHPARIETGPRKPH